MRITLKRPYKSLHPFASDELNDLTIITGKNGSGKTQLLSLLKDIVKSDISSMIEIEPKCFKIQYEGIVKENTLVLANGNVTPFLSNLESQYKLLTESVKELYDFLIKNKFNFDLNNFKKKFSKNNEYKYLIKKVFLDFPHLDLQPKTDANRESHTLSIWLGSDRKLLFLFLTEICQFTHKKVTELNSSDFYTTPIPERFLDKVDLFTSEIETLFYYYARRRDLNRRKYFDKKEDGENNEAFPDHEFIDRFTPPWVTINNILSENNIDFQFVEIDKKSFSPEVLVSVKLHKTQSIQLLSIESLSSGEKLIIGLILKLFTSKYYEKDLSFPDLLILDEPDAYLHPEMTKIMLHILGEIFVKKYGIKVILTTHSPTTIALADESQIYQLTNEANSGLKKLPKDEALKILTGFIPTLSIDYKNHRQVFVESPTDVFYYQALHDRHIQTKSLPYKLYFIANSQGKGNSFQVQNILKELRRSGNSTSYGIIDWDCENESSDFLFVHGYKERYSLENFLLDPIYIVCLLIEIKAHNVFNEFKISENFNQYLLGQETNERIQEISEIFFAAFESKFRSNKYDSKKIRIEYLNGKIAEFPEWYLQMQGHELLLKVMEIYPALNNKYTKEGVIQKALTIIMVKCYPFVPMTSINLIEDLGLR